MTIDDDRIAYLAGEDRSGLDPSERHALDDIRGLLADRSLWEEPPTTLEADIVAAITTQAGVRTAEANHDRRALGRQRLLAVAAAVVVVLAAGTIALRPWHHRGPAAQHFAMTLV